MNDKDNPAARETQPIPARELIWRVAWIGIRLMLVYVLAGEFQPFFYQAF